MAPHQQLTVADTIRPMPVTYDDFVTRRDNTQTIGFADSQTLAVMCVSFSFAAISVIAALFAFYWFVRMRRGFRQDMIMLLIQSDMAKSLWLIISPLFYFVTKKPFSSNWVFCQVSGFFLAVTVEASDIAVLLIAIHTALFVVKRQHPDVALGLQPYRRVAYTLWAVVPIILASIVPITGGSFVDNGPHCYLPIRPSWYHNALAWVPRYIIIGFIIVTYTWLYLYVYFHFRRFGEDQRRASNPSSGSNNSSAYQQMKRKWRSHSVPPTPLLATHHLLDSPHDTIIRSDPPRLRQYSATSTVSTLQISENVCLPAAPERVERKSSISWNMIDFDGTRSSASAMSCFETVPTSPTAESSQRTSNNAINANNKTAGAEMSPIAKPEPSHPANGGRNSSHSPHGTQHNMWKQRLRTFRSHQSDVGPRNSVTNIIAALRQDPPPTEHTNNDDGGLELDSSSSSVRLPTEVSEEAMRRSRDKMKRQMRLLFVYPAIYILTWIAPFVTHVYRYNNVYVAPPVGANITTSAGLVFFDSAFGHINTRDGYGGAANVHPAAVLSRSQTLFAPLAMEPLALRIISMASLCIGAAVDCAFFSAWERPWSHLRGGFWECLAIRLRIHRLYGGAADEETDGPGRNRDERVADERAARTRRDKEREMGLRSKMVATAAAAAAAGSSGSTAGGRRGGSEGVIPIEGRTSGTQQGRRREWWDALDEATL